MDEIRRPDPLDLYRRYSEARPAAKDVGTIMPYDWIWLPDPLEATWMIYSQMLGDYAREIANGINAFTMNVRRLNTWSMLMPTLSAAEQNEATHEFIEPAATLALLSPYMIRSRFIFATAHLCHQVNLIRHSEWPESSLPPDAEIYMAAADVQGRPWSSYGLLKIRIEALAGRSLRTATADFRNAFTHRFSPRVERGITNFAGRHVNESTGEVYYTLGGHEPLGLANVAKLLAAELDKCYGAFEAFQGLVAEHENFITPYNAEALRRI